jgi:hypothetical protein
MVSRSQVFRKQAPQSSLSRWLGPVNWEQHSSCSAKKSATFCVVDFAYKFNHPVLTAPKAIGMIVI